MAGRARLFPFHESCQKIQSRAEPKLGNAKPVDETVRQIIPGKENMARFREPVLETEIRIVKAFGNRDTAFPPFDLCLLVLHRAIL